MAEQISLRSLTEKVDNGWKLVELVEHFGTNKSEMKRLLKEGNLKIKKTRKARFVLVNDLNATFTSNQELVDIAKESSTEISEQQIAVQQFTEEQIEKAIH